MLAAWAGFLCDAQALAYCRTGRRLLDTSQLPRLSIDADGLLRDVMNGATQQGADTSRCLPVQARLSCLHGCLLPVTAKAAGSVIL